MVTSRLQYAARRQALQEPQGPIRSVESGALKEGGEHESALSRAANANRFNPKTNFGSAEMTIENEQSVE